MDISYVDHPLSSKTRGWMPNVPLALLPWSLPKQEEFLFGGFTIEGPRLSLDVEVGVYYHL